MVWYQQLSTLPLEDVSRLIQGGVGSDLGPASRPSRPGRRLPLRDRRPDRRGPRLPRLADRGRPRPGPAAGTCRSWPPAPPATPTSRPWRWPWWCGRPRRSTAAVVRRLGGVVRVPRPRTRSGGFAPVDPSTVASWEAPPGLGQPSAAARAASNSSTAAAAAALSESTPPTRAWGSPPARRPPRTTPPAGPGARTRPPAPRAPTAAAASRARWRRGRRRRCAGRGAAARPSPRGVSPTPTGTPNSAPCEARTTWGLNTSVTGSATTTAGPRRRRPTAAWRRGCRASPPRPPPGRGGPASGAARCRWVGGVVEAESSKAKPGHAQHAVGPVPERQAPEHALGHLDDLGPAAAARSRTAASAPTSEPAGQHLVHPHPGAQRPGQLTPALHQEAAGAVALPPLAQGQRGLDPGLAVLVITRPCWRAGARPSAAGAPPWGGSGRSASNSVSRTRSRRTARLRLSDSPGRATRASSLSSASSRRRRSDWRPPRGPVPQRVVGVAPPGQLGVEVGPQVVVGQAGPRQQVLDQLGERAGPHQLDVPVDDRHQGAGHRPRRLAVVGVGQPVEADRPAPAGLVERQPPTPPGVGGGGRRRRRATCGCRAPGGGGAAGPGRRRSRPSPG